MRPRTLAKVIPKISASFPVLLLTGPRQVGKTTLLQQCMERGRGYVTLDDFEARQLAQRDPALFLQRFPPPVLIDEVQYAPQLFSQIKMVVDKQKKTGLYWLTGSQKFHLMKGISESLAGRVAILDLLGLSQAELDDRASVSQPFTPTPAWLVQARKHKADTSVDALYQRIWLGSFPAVCTYPETRDIFYRSYVQTYIQRDVKDLLRISDETAFHNFLITVAARTGQLLNYAELARDVAIDNKTAKTWLSILETSGLVFLLRPYYRNLTKRIIKTPKLYFLDTGLCSYLTRWPTAESLAVGAMAGAILETYCVAEILKSHWHNAREAHCYYYRDMDQKEIDFLLESGNCLYPVEIKRSATPGLSAARHFPQLGKLGKAVGSGAVLCLVSQDVPLSKDVNAIPIGYL